MNFRPTQVLVSAAILAVSQGAAFAQDDDEADEAIKAKLRVVATALEEQLEEEFDKLREVRDTVAEEKPDLAAQMQTTAATLREKQREYDIARSTHEAVTKEFEKAEQQLSLWRQERNYIDGLLLDFRKNYEAASSLARVGAEEEQLKSSAGLAEEGGTEARIDLVESFIDRLAATGGPEVINGKALNPEGQLTEGTFVEAGPVIWFLSADKSLGGLVDGTRELVPEVLPETATTGEIAKLINGESGSPNFDPTLGSAIALEEVEETLLDHVKKGGVWIYPILFLALVALIAAIVKWIGILRIRDLRPDTVQEVIAAVNDNETAKAEEALAGLTHPAAAILRCGIEESGRTREGLEEKLFERHSELLPKLQSGLPFIAIAAATAPLLGLLGTVTGMIQTFQKITIYGTGDAKPLAGGISEALVTTEFGLIVAIPALIVHALLSRKTSGIRSTMELTSIAFLNGVKPSGKAKTKSRAKTKSA
ncbi:MAG: MotA/TolQ/ExbB proton channel family protein [Verrucomicrobiota bacterium]